MKSLIFSRHETLQQEMERLTKLRESRPEDSEIRLRNGQLLLDLAKQGSVGDIRRVLECMDPSHLLQYYTVKMFEASVLNRHLSVATLMLQNGFQVSTYPVLRDLLHRVIDINSQEDSLQPTLRLLLDAGMDVNFQRVSDLFTPLHVACSLGLHGISCLLVLYGADVNAVAKNDRMPLICAEEAVGGSETENLIEFLLESRAKRTWRKPTTIVQSFSGLSMQEGIMLDTL